MTPTAQQQQIMDFVKSMERDDAIFLVNEVLDRFGWVGSFFVTEDVIQVLEDEGYEATGENLDAVMDTLEWRRGITEAMDATGWDLIFDAVKATMEGK